MPPRRILYNPVLSKVSVTDFHINFDNPAQLPQMPFAYTQNKNISCSILLVLTKLLAYAHCTYEMKQKSLVVMEIKKYFCINVCSNKVRLVMISRMAKPEEVLVVENDQGEVVREFMKDTDSINLYKNMRETLGKFVCWCLYSHVVCD